ncbi:MAG: hypothetical protein MJ252_00135 [archaeon]|nr:hypothetical protein [archaeon]
MNQLNEDNYSYKKNTPLLKIKGNNQFNPIKLKRNESCKDYRGSNRLNLRNNYSDYSQIDSENLKIPNIIRNDSPFMSQFDQNVLNRIQTKKRFKDFIYEENQGKGEYKEIKNYVTVDPSKSPLLYNFRDVNKDKWVDNQGWK